MCINNRKPGRYKRKLEYLAVTTGPHYDSRAFIVSAKRESRSHRIPGRTLTVATRPSIGAVLEVAQDIAQPAGNLRKDLYRMQSLPTPVKDCRSARLPSGRPLPLRRIACLRMVRLGPGQKTEATTVYLLHRPLSLKPTTKIRSPTHVRFAIPARGDATIFE